MHIIGKGLDDVQERQRRRKVAALKESCKNALWFAETFDIDLISQYNLSRLPVMKQLCVTITYQVYTYNTK